MNLDELKKILAPLRKQTDKAMPIKRDDLMKRYGNWMSIEKRRKRQLYIYCLTSNNNIC